MNAQKWFTLAGSISFLIAALHIAVIFFGAEAYRYFGAGESMASMAEAGSMMPALLTTGIVLVFVIFGLYAYSGAGYAKKMPLLKTGLIVITVIYLLRGLGFFVEVLGIVYQYDVPLRHIVFSFVALTTGLVHLLGLRKGWRALG